MPYTAFLGRPPRRLGAGSGTGSSTVTALARPPRLDASAVAASVSDTDATAITAAFDSAGASGRHDLKAQHIWAGSPEDQAELAPNSCRAQAVAHRQAVLARLAL